jgi:putative heme iron utilization protein
MREIPSRPAGHFLISHLSFIRRGNTFEPSNTTFGGMIMNTHDTQTLSSRELEQVLTTMNQKRPEDVLLFAQVYGKQNTAQAACIVDMDRDGMELENDFQHTTPKRLNIHFKAPLDSADQANAHLEEMTKRAHELAGHNSQEVMGRTISKLLPKWFRH